MTQTVQTPPFIDRRSPYSDKISPGRERRQFANRHDDLSSEAKELADAIDQYKLVHRRRFITFDEMLQIVQTLGYKK